MAKKIKVDIDVDSKSVDKAAKSLNDMSNTTSKLGNLKKELKEINLRLVELKLAGQENSEEFKKLAARGAELTDTMGDVRNQIAGMASDSKRLDQVIGAFQGIAAIAGVAQGAMSALGLENADYEKSMQKMMGIMSAMQSLQSLQNLLQKESTLMLGLQDLKTKALAVSQAIYTTTVGTSTGALKIFKLALLGTGIGAIIVALGLLIVNWDNLTSAIFGSNKAFVSNKKLIEDSILSYDGLTKSLDNYLNLKALELQGTDDDLKVALRILNIEQQTLKIKNEQLIKDEQVAKQEFENINKLYLTEKVRAEHKEEIDNAHANWLKIFNNLEEVNSKLKINDIKLEDARSSIQDDNRKKAEDAHTKQIANLKALNDLTQKIDTTKRTAYQQEINTINLKYVEERKKLTELLKDTKLTEKEKESYRLKLHKNNLAELKIVEDKFNETQLDNHKKFLENIQKENENYEISKLEKSTETLKKSAKNEYDYLESIYEIRKKRFDHDKNKELNDREEMVKNQTLSQEQFLQEKMEIESKYQQLEKDKKKEDAEEFNLFYKEKLDEQIELDKAAEEKKLEIKKSNQEAAFQSFNSYLEISQTLQDIEMNKELENAGNSERKKEEVRKKYAKKQQELAIAKTIMNGMEALIKTDANVGLPFSLILKIMQIAQTGAAISAIKSQKFASGVVDLKFSDKIPAMLSPGESVTTAYRTQQYKDELNQIRSGTLNKGLSGSDINKLATALGNVINDKQVILSMGDVDNFNNVQKTVLSNSKF